MAPLLVLVAVTVGLRYGSRWRAPGGATWPTAARFGLAAMFAVTGTSHFIGMREEMVEMVPPGLPQPELLVSITGALELLGAAGLIWRRTTHAAAIALGLLLVAMFPAKVHAATAGVAHEWTSQLFPRSILQVLFIATVGTVAYSHRPGVGPTSTSHRRSVV